MSDISDAAARLNAASNDQVAQRVIVIDKLAFQSAGVVSLSMTFIGYLLSDYRYALSATFFELPLYLYLFTSWALLGTTLICSVLVRWWSAKYVVWEASANYFGLNLSAIAAEVNGQTDFAAAAAAAKDRMDTITKVKKTSDRQAAIALRVRNAIITAALTCYLLGFSMLLITVSATLHRIIFG